MNIFNKLKHVKTLLINDDEFIRNSFELAFKTKGCALQVAPNAEQGLGLLNQDRFDLIISDFRLPDMNGLEFLKRASDASPGAVNVLITAYRDDHIFSEALRQGISNFVEKPFTVTKLITALTHSFKTSDTIKEV